MAKKKKAKTGSTQSKKSRKSSSSGENSNAAEASASPALTEAAALEIQNLLSEQDVVLTDAEGSTLLPGRGLRPAGPSGHLLPLSLPFALEKDSKPKKKIIADGKLTNYIEELTARYSDKFIELLRKDLRTEKDFIGALHELNLDVDEAESDDDDSDEDDKSYLEEIRGVSASDDSSNEY